MLIRFILGVSSRVLGSEVSGFKCPISGCVLFPLTSDDLFLQLSNL